MQIDNLQKIIITDTMLSLASHENQGKEFYFLDSASKNTIRDTITGLNLNDVSLVSQPEIIDTLFITSDGDSKLDVAPFTIIKLITQSQNYAYFLASVNIYISDRDNSEILIKSYSNPKNGLYIALDDTIDKNRYNISRLQYKFSFIGNFEGVTDNDSIYYIPDILENSFLKKDYVVNYKRIEISDNLKGSTVIDPAFKEKGYNEFLDIMIGAPAIQANIIYIKKNVINLEDLTTEEKEDIKEDAKNSFGLLGEQLLKDKLKNCTVYDYQKIPKTVILLNIMDAYGKSELYFYLNTGVNENGVILEFIRYEDLIDLVDIKKESVLYLFQGRNQKKILSQLDKRLLEVKNIGKDTISSLVALSDSNKKSYYKNIYSIYKEI